MAPLEMMRSAVDFQHMQSHSRSRTHPLLVIRYRENGLERTRFGISTGRSVGNAVVRNRLRRRLRTILASLGPQLERGWDVLIVVRPSAANARQVDLEQALLRMTRAAGLSAAAPDPATGGAS
ncbi:hypothetical protein BH24CHL5_BH24CHL5_09700 [soil metagenome]